jgi:hypothetical protein
MDVAQGSDYFIRRLTDILPDAFSRREETGGSRTRGMVFRFTFDLRIGFPKSVISVPDGICEGVTSIEETDSNVKANFGRSHCLCSYQVLIPRQSA